MRFSNGLNVAVHEKDLRLIPRFLGMMVSFSRTKDVRGRTGLWDEV